MSSTIGSKDAGPGFAPARCCCGVFPDPRCWVAGGKGGQDRTEIGWVGGLVAGSQF